MFVSPYLSVVPAKAGTHNPGHLLLKNVVD